MSVRRRFSLVVQRCKAPDCGARCGLGHSFCDTCYGRVPATMKRDLCDARSDRDVLRLARHIAVAREWLAQNPVERREQWWQRL